MNNPFLPLYKRAGSGHELAQFDSAHTASVDLALGSGNR